MSDNSYGLNIRISANLLTLHNLENILNQNPLLLTKLASLIKRSLAAVLLDSDFEVEVTPTKITEERFQRQIKWHI